MPYINTRRLHSIVGRKVSRYFSYRKAKRMFNEINRDISLVEARFVKARINHI